MENHVLNRLVDGFDEFRERLTRIEESVKPIADITKDVGILKVQHSSVEQSTKSAHKRLDALEAEKLANRITDLANLVSPIIENEKERQQDMKFMKRTTVGYGIGMFFTVVGGLIMALAKGWI